MKDFTLKAMFSDGTEDYRSPSEPMPGDTVHIRFRSATKDLKEVWLIHGDEKIPMELEERNKDFDYYECSITVGEEPYAYHFFLVDDDFKKVFDVVGISDDVRPQYEFCIFPGFTTPDWAKGVVMYQIFTDRFYNGDPENDVVDHEYFYLDRHVKKIDSWDQPPAAFDFANFYGGDLAGIIEKLDYLSDLGIEAIYLNPIFVSASNHKYDTQDYGHVDPHIGVIKEDADEILDDKCRDNRKAGKFIKRVTSEENLAESDALLAELIQKAHERGIKVILDGVFNHCGSFNRWLDKEKIYNNKGAYYDPESPYKSYFSFQDKSAYPDNATYETWWGNITLPKLNYDDCPELEEYILGVARKWVSEPYCADGWRLDVASDLGHTPEYNHAFWKKFRKTVKEANPDAVIIAEHYGDPREYLQGGEWDSIMNYCAFFDPVSLFFTGMEKHSYEYKEFMLGNAKEFTSNIFHYLASFPTQSIFCAMNELSNHDHSRFLTRTNHKCGKLASLGAKAAGQDVNKGVLREATVMMMTWPGAPTIYYGDEAGQVGFTDPDSRRTYPWGHEDKELVRFHKEIIKVHKSSSVFRTGSTKIIAADKNMLAFGRFNREEQFIVVFNNDKFNHSLSIRVRAAGLPKTCTLRQVMYTNEEGFSVSPVEYEVEDGELSIGLPAFSSVILKRI